MPQMMPPPRENPEAKGQAKVQESKAQEINTPEPQILEPKIPEPKTLEPKTPELKTQTAPIDFYQRETEVFKKNQLQPEAEPEPPFHSGDVVALQAELRLDRDGSVTAVPVYPGGLSPRAPNSFDLGPLEDNPQLRNLLGGTANLTVTVSSHSHNSIAFSFSATEAKPTEVQPLESYSEEYLKTQSGRYVGVEGTVVAVNERSEKSPAQLVMRLADGQEITLGYHQSRLSYSGGVQDTVSRKPVATGDAIRVTAFVHSTGELSLSNDPFMTAPSTQRQELYDNVRAEVGEHFAGLASAIEAKNWQEARVIAGKTALLDTSQHERLSLKKMIERMPAHERPIVSPELIEDGFARKLSEAYHTNLFAMTQNEFIDFTAELSTGKLGFPVGVDSSYAYRLFDAARIEPEMRERLLTQSISALRPLVAGVTAENVDFNNSYMLRQGIGYLATVDTPTASAFLVNLLVQETTLGNFTRPNEKRADRVGSIIPELASSISGRAAEDPFDPGLRQGFHSLKAVEDFLRKNSDEGWAVRSLQDAIGDITRAMEAPMALNQLKIPSRPKVA